MGECEHFLAGCMWIWVGVTFFGWMWVGVAECTVYNQHICDKTHNSNENAPCKKDLLTSINFLPMSLLSSFWEKHYQRESDPI